MTIQSDTMRSTVVGLRVRRTIRLGKHARINLSRSGVGVSGGVKGLTAGVGPRGARVTASVPGTGLSYEQRVGGRGKKRAKQQKSRRAGCARFVVFIVAALLILVVVVAL